MENQNKNTQTHYALKKVILTLCTHVQPTAKSKLAKDSSLFHSEYTNFKFFLKNKKPISQKNKGEIPALQWRSLWNCHQHEAWYSHQNRTDEQSQVAAEEPDNTAQQSTFPPKSTKPHIKFLQENKTQMPKHKNQEGNKRNLSSSDRNVKGRPHYRNP